MQDQRQNSMIQSRQIIIKIPFTNEEKLLVQHFYLQFGSRSSGEIAGEMINNPQVPAAIQQITKTRRERRQQRRCFAITPSPLAETDGEDEKNQSPSPRRTLNTYLIKAAIPNRDAARLCCDVAAAAIKRLQEL
ncbi:unnamed protein product [Didymodactylos carnosus]|uniref:Uncharacterized protein n=1 Tax=Didymodactylos carnosus TaxID=1234261 RepID=A0A814BQ64_9BILA|nr:unnamed protein product [Didymodactylos carnosus]CAF3710202.1 unnamed protein product [Didymodactylos carnosus]